MKKKILWGVLTACLVLALVSCDSQAYDNLASFMGSMSNNVYGIKPDMEDVAAVSTTIDNSVATDEDGKITINLEEASDIIQQLSEIATSTQKMNQAKENLTTEIKVEGKTSAEIQTALKDTLKVVQTALPSADTVSDDRVKTAINEVNDALTTIIDSIPETPTQADLATVVIINSLATQIDELSKKEDLDTSDAEEMIPLVNTALAALDALKVTTEVSNLDILGELDLTSLYVSSKKDKDETSSKAITSEETMKYVRDLQENLLTLVSLMSEKNDAGEYVFSKTKYDRFILQMTAIRTSYDIASLGLMPSFSIVSAKLDEAMYEKLQGAEEGSVNAFETIDDFFTQIFDLNYNNNFTLNDLTLYAISVAATEMDKLYTTIFQENVDLKSASDVYAKFLEDNKENLLKSPLEDIDFTAFDLDVSEKLTTDQTYEICHKAITAARTIIVISLESGVNEDLIYKYVPGGSDIKEAGGIGQLLSNYIQLIIHNLDPKEE